MTIDRLDAMRTFVSIVDAGSFSAAAKRLGISVPAISRRLSGFEERIGTSLLHRTTRSIDITEYGQIYYDRATRILSEIEEVELELAGMRNAPTGLLKVAAPSVFGRAFVAPVIPAFLNKYPRVRVDLALVRAADAIEPEAVDAAIQLGGGERRALGSRTLGSFRQVLCASPEYLQRAGRPVAPADLVHHDCVVESTMAGTSGWHFVEDGRERELPIEGRLACDDSEAVLNAVLAGSGVAQIPSFQARDHVRARKLEILLQAFEPAPTPMRVLYAKQGSAVAKVSAFVQFLTNNIPQDRLAL